MDTYEEQTTLRYEPEVALGIIAGALEEDGFESIETSAGVGCSPRRRSTRKRGRAAWWCGSRLRTRARRSRSRGPPTASRRSSNRRRARRSSGPSRPWPPSRTENPAWAGLVEVGDPGLE